jgi:undecaprenyl-diphosphatase
MSLMQSIWLAIVEGLTEYLPISSTGHMILASSLMGINEDDFVKNYEIIIQFGAILSVVVLYRERFFRSLEFYWKLFFAFIPAAVIGLLVKNKIDALLGDIRVVAWALIGGGLILILTDRYFIEHEKTGDIDHMTRKNAFIIGLAQCCAFIPGVSRSASSILGGLTQKLSRQSAAEFSFFLAVPTLTAASALKTYKVLSHFHSDQVALLLLGNLISFVVGLFTIRAFMKYIFNHGFFAFGIYRVIVGGFILIMLALGHSFSMS